MIHNSKEGFFRCNCCGTGFFVHAVDSKRISPTCVCCGSDEIKEADAKTIYAIWNSMRKGVDLDGSANANEIIEISMGFFKGEDGERD